MITKTKIIFSAFFILLISILEISYGQNTYKKFIEGGWNAASTSSNIIMLSNGHIQFNERYGYEFDLFDSMGTLQSSFILKDSSIIGSGGFESKEFSLKLNDSIYFFILGTQFNNTSQPVISKFNLFNKKFIDQKYFSNSFLGTYSIKSGKNKSMLIAGYVGDTLQNLTNFKVRPLLISLDSNLNIINNLKITNRKGSLIFGFETTDHHFVTGMTVDTVGACIAKIDTMGNVLWAKSYFRPQGIIHTALENTDGTYTVWGSLDSGTLSTFDPANNFLMKIDTSGQVLWCKHFGDSLLSFETYYGSGNLVQTYDSGYIITSTIAYIDQFGFQRKLVMIKTDSNGDTLWTRCHGASTVSSFGTSIQETTDGGYLVAGASNSKQWLYGGMYILKTDSLGMTASHCQEFNYPIPFGNFVVNDSNIFLNFASGLVQVSPSLLYDSAIAIPPNIDGCWLSGVGITEHEVKLNQIYSAIPNPSNGLFTLKTNMENNDPITVLIYDIFGHELLLLPNITAQEQQLDLSDYPPGMYFVKIIQGGKVEVLMVLLQ